MAQNSVFIVRKAMRAVPEMSKYVDEGVGWWVDYGGSMERMRAVSESVLDEEVKDLFASPSLSHEYKVKKAQHIQRHIQAWRARNRRLVLAGVEAPDGNVPDTQAGCAALLADHWGR
eukprot:1774790-Pyramimonas_sp.AAC.1